ncbi:hypothetical protein [Xinfangfangia pollutisoli]|uniref:hypothetical protein n=1 Tax=Xinfangfangia pollutisoli TaxID=2865960 RepID=UPI001CD60CE3|nr:hypothetical protein [Xinfangfangia pollutisoli]
MSEPKFPDLTLAQAILKTVAHYTGRVVHGAEVYAFSDFLQVTVSLAEDGSVEVGFEDPNVPGSRVPA